MISKLVFLDKIYYIHHVRRKELWKSIAFFALNIGLFSDLTGELNYTLNVIGKRKGWACVHCLTGKHMSGCTKDGCKFI